MNKKILLTYILFHSAVFADKSEKSFTLQAKSCEELYHDLDNIKKWQKIESTDKNLSNEKCQCIGDKCQLDINKYLPKIAKEYHGVNPAISGPNCGNSTLVAAGILPYHRYTSNEELNFWINSPLCKKRQNFKDRQPGDLIIFTELEKKKFQKNIHGLIYVSDNIVWNKNSFDKRSEYELTTFNSVLSDFNVNKKCTKGSEDCNKFMTAYSCQKWEDYWNKIDDKKKEKLDLEFEKQINSVECQLQKTLFNKSKDSDLMQFIQNTVNIIQFDVVEKIHNLKEDTPEEERLLLERAQYRIESIQAQLYINEDSENQ